MKDLLVIPVNNVLRSGGLSEYEDGAHATDDWFGTATQPVLVSNTTGLNPLPAAATNSSNATVTFIDHHGANGDTAATSGYSLARETRRLSQEKTVAAEPQSPTANFAATPASPILTVTAEPLPPTVHGAIKVAGAGSNDGLSLSGGAVGVTIQTIYCFDGSATYPNFRDAEKVSIYFGSTDSNLCWAGTASNMLYWSGWGRVYDGFTPHDEDSVFDYYRAHFKNNGGWNDCAIAWFLNGDTTNIAEDIKVAGGDFYRNFDVDSYMTQDSYTNDNYMLALKEELEAGKVAGLSVYWLEGGGHAITCWGMEVNTSLATSNKNYVTALWVSDSDDSVNGSNPYIATNSLKRCALSYDNIADVYLISVPYGNESSVATLEYWTTLAARPAGSATHDVSISNLSVTQSAVNTANNTGSVGISFTLNNLAAQTFSNFKVTLYIDNVASQTWTVAALTGTNYADYYGITKSGIASGAHTFKVVADSGYNYWEANESNNTASKAFNWAAPAAVTGLSGYADDALGVLSWAAASSINGISRYQYQISVNAAFTSTVRDGTVATNHVSVPVPAGSYFWRVRAIDGSSQSGAWSYTSAFTSITTSLSSYRLDRRLYATTATSDYYGTAVAISGRSVLTGACGKSALKGMVYLNRWTGTAYSVNALYASDGKSGDKFGYSLDLYGNTAVVGAKYHDGRTDAGAAYVFRWTGTAYTQVKLMASDRAADDHFGISTAIYGNVVAVGASGDDDKGANSGSAYAYHWDGVRYTQYKLLASDGAAGDNFGCAVAAATDRIVVGAMYDDDKGANSGGAYVYHWSGSRYVQYKLSGRDLDSYDYFGSAVAISGSRIAVSAASKENSNGSRGCVYVFTWSGKEYVQTAKLMASDGNYIDDFGSSVAISGSTVIVGAKSDRYNNVSVGSVYIYKWNGSSYVESKITAYNKTTENNFGNAVGISGEFVVAGSLAQSSLSSGAGSTYIYQDTADNAKRLVPPSIPDLFSNHVTAKRALLDWGDSYDCGGGVIRYQVQLSRSSVFTSPVINSTVSTSQLQTGLLTTGVNYYWRVRAIDSSANFSDWSRSAAFAVSRSGTLAIAT